MTATPTKSELREMLRQAVLNTGGATAIDGLLENARNNKNEGSSKIVNSAPVSRNPPAKVVAKIDMPTADDVATAIIVAAAETGEDPIACASRVEGMRCRHYAMHALSHVFPGTGRYALARMVGCQAKPQYFWKNSVTHVLNGMGPGKRAKWWDEAAYQRVIEAIR